MTRATPAPARSGSAAYAAERAAPDPVLVERLSLSRGEPEWMRALRLESLEHFRRRPLPHWGGDLSELDFARVPLAPSLDAPAAAGGDDTWGELPRELRDAGVIVLGMDEALRAHEEIVRRYWGSVCPSSDNAFSALNGALWDGGTFVFVPEGVRVERPLRLRRRPRDRGLYEHTVIVVGAGATLAYEESLEGAVAAADALHAGVMEVVVEPHARCRVTTVRRWAGAVYHLVTKRALAHAEATMEWVDAGAGGRVTMTYPSVYLAGTGAHGVIHSLAVAGDGEHEDTGGKLVVSAPGCRGRVSAHLVARGSGRATYRGLVKVARGATAADCAVRYDTLLADPGARFDAHPYIEIEEADAAVAHESAVTRGADSPAAVRRFLEPALRELPADAAAALAALAGADEPGASGVEGGDA